jgi:hypothetical protein
MNVMLNLTMTAIVTTTGVMVLIVNLLCNIVRSKRRGRVSYCHYLAVCYYRRGMDW